MPKKERIYLSGAITNNPNYKKEFASSAKYFRKKGLRVINPASYPTHKNWTWEDYMRRCIKLLSECTAIFMITEWKNSKGACLEHYIAEQLGLEIVDFTDGNVR